MGRVNLDLLGFLLRFMYLIGILIDCRIHAVKKSM